MSDRVWLTLLGVVVLSCAARASGDSAKPANAGDFAFVDVTVIPMDLAGAVPGQTVLVSDGVITSIGPVSRVRPRAGDTVIDGRGKFLIPGLAEMHAHVPGGNAPEQLVRDIMFLYVANGVTTIRGMLGAPMQLELREQLARGEIVGPTLFVGAPSLNGQSAPTPEAAARLVREHQAAGYDFLKLHPGLLRPAYDALVATAREIGITFAGHVSAAVGLERTLEARQSTIDHLDGYLEASLPEPLRARMMAGPVPFSEWVPAVEPALVRYWAGRTRDAGTWNVPTAFLWESFYSAESPEEAAQRPEMRYASPQQVNQWMQQKRNMTQSQRNQNIRTEDIDRFLELRRLALRSLGDSGALLLMGTDSPQMFNVPGFALHREVVVMQEVGLTPFQILESGTRNVARYAERDLGLDGKFGSVVAGNRADLVLLDADPLANVRNLARRSGVMVRGRWLPAAELQQRLDEMARRYRPGP
ncbi:MAG TPA: amidohydrolase family protein [Gemmatimonadaceae bacterium]|nr:amidohydrolase family protein [Gemmatimonadaceae bacterium]